MIIVKLIGGLGNQMFQYAAGRRLAHFLETDLKLDISSLNRGEDAGNFRQYELKHFYIFAQIASENEVNELIGGKEDKFKRILLKINTLLLSSSKHPKLVKERQFHFDRSILKLGDNSYLNGYWQSEKYFADISNIIRKELSVKHEQTSLNRDMSDRIKGCNSVSLHVRRGDYVVNNMPHETHGICDIPYYEKCVKYISSKISDPHFFIFSDDQDWTMKNLHLNFPATFVDHNSSENSYEDLRLMSQCAHNIVANSSFSWWGAWLNPNPEKITISPEPWFDIKADYSDIIPDAWIKIKKTERQSCITEGN